MSARKCHATNRRGEPCQAPPLKDDDYCAAHTTKLPEDKRFGSPVQAGIAGGSPKPHVPGVIEAMAQRVLDRADEIIDAYFQGLGAERAVVVGNGPSARVEHVPDPPTRMSAADRLLDRVVGKPRQAMELTGAEGGPVAVSGGWDLSRLDERELIVLKALHAKARGDGGRPAE